MPPCPHEREIEMEIKERKEGMATVEMTQEELETVIRAVRIVTGNAGHTGGKRATGGRALDALRRGFGKLMAASTSMKMQQVLEVG